MNSVALRILLGDRVKYVGLIFGIAFSTMLMSNQTSIFIGLMLRTANQILDAREADIWVMDPRVDYVDEIEPMTDTQLARVRGVDGVDWAVPFLKGLTVAHTRDGILQQVNLLVANYGAAFGSFMLVTGGALVVGKAVLVANATQSIRRYDRAPLIRPILFKAAFYWAVVLVARLLEHWIRFWLVEHHPLGTFLPYMVATFDWHHFIAIQLWILVVFVIYETATELNHLFGEGELWHLLVTSRAPNCR